MLLDIFSGRLERIVHNWQMASDFLKPPRQMAFVFRGIIGLFCCINNRLAIVIETLASSHELESQESFIKIIVPCVLRFVTCRCLDISHTCIHEIYKVIDAEKVQEAQDVEHLLIEELEGP